MEIWKDISNYEGLYQISNKGRIKNKKRNKIKKQTINKDGYCIIKLSKKNKKKVYLVHRLVAEEFLDYHLFKKVERESNVQFDRKHLVINHKDEDKTNNKVENLEWCTNLYNIEYSSHSKKRKTIKEKLYSYMLENNIEEKTVNIIMNFFN